MNSLLQKFMFDAAPVRGSIVSLQDAWQEVLARRTYPAPVRDVLGEMMAACALLSANLKFNGTLIMQIFGDGPVHMLVVQCTQDLAMRATAHLATDAVIDEGMTLTQLVNAGGRGRCAITLDPGERQPGQQPWQGIVPLVGEQGPLPSIAAVIGHYMRYSEQLDTRLWLTANQECAAGMLLQKLPEDGGIVPLRHEPDADTWERVCILANTLTRDELLGQPPRSILGRLFWQENVRLFAPLVAHFQCSCSRQKVGAMLRMLGRGEVDSVLAEQGQVEIRCDYCNQCYEFDAIDIAQLFHADGPLHGAAPVENYRH